MGCRIAREHGVTTRIVLSSKFLRLALRPRKPWTERSQNAFVLNCELFTDCSRADLDNNSFRRAALIFDHALLQNNCPGKTVGLVDWVGLVLRAKGSRIQVPGRRCTFHAYYTAVSLADSSRFFGRNGFLQPRVVNALLLALPAAAIAHAPNDRAY